ncbi:hypothetical protein E3N88_34952 [Mikania micrantha]|uniref:Uncharacterized protein n=1 Tax=Mikania micrantha TaxID=192012 RepID=A0A5N6LZZ4_9ASTR|nr:hypothetical protein E3N88_34952 [Mikania micrantha]
MSRNDDRNREIRENPFLTTKLGLLGFSGTHRGTRWPNRRPYSGTRQASRGFESRISSRIAKPLFGLSSRLAITLGAWNHHQSLEPASFEVPGALEALLNIISVILKLGKVATYSL